MADRISSLSTEYVAVPFTASVDPDSLEGVELGFVAGTSDDEPEQWHTAIIEDGAAKLLVGPDQDVTFTAGTWSVWTKITDNPEIPVEKSGHLYVY